ncbi:hypothetical protein C0J52_08486 [Blattella germanica]|nr:hypothetical protein C0J52_08486 [Blattella germanica]
MMKKQFFRVKQLTDQRFFRAGKTEVLSDDLQEADRKVEYIRNACSNLGKKLGPMCSGQESSREKRLKKNPEHTLGLTMQENGVCEEECLLSTVLTDCAKVQMNLANEALDHEIQVEQLVVIPLHQMLEAEVPNIQKTKSKLAKLTLDMDSARTRYQTALKHGGANTSSIKNELEDAEQKVEQCRDVLASEMFQLISREADLAQIVVQYARLQRAYHESALKFLEETIPELENNINDSPTKPMYGFPLEDHLRVTGRKVAFPIELCVCALLELGMEEEGLFRIAGGASKVRRMRMSFDACCLTLPTALEYRDPHVIAGALKLYLRELPEPLMTRSLYEEWMAAARIQTSNEARLQALKQVVDKLPPANYDNLQYLIKFLSALSRNQEVNKMTPQNIAIVIAPNLIWSLADETSTIGMNMSSANTYSFIIDNMVNHADWFFPGDIEFFQTFPRETTLINGMTSSTGSVSGLQAQEWTGGSPTDRGHTRGSSGEGQLISLGEPGVMKRTQSNSSLSDHSSPPHGSPKPAARRKNKPAPVPPACNASPKETSSASHDKPEKPPRPTVGPISSTLPRPSKKHSGEHEVRTAIAVTTEAPPIVTMEKQQKSSDNYVPVAVRKQSMDGLEQPQNCVIPISTHRRISSSGGEKVSIEAGKLGDSSESSSLTEQTQSVPPASNTTTVTVMSGSTPKVSSTFDNSQQKSIGHPQVGSSSTLERKHPQRPVAAPRNAANICASSLSSREIQNQSSENKTSESVSTKTSNEAESAGGQDAVVLRRPDSGERSNKPAVPERPATLLRPHSSFRGSRHSADSDGSSGDKSNTESERPMLERTHMYSVDKQQVSIIHVGGDKEKTVAVPSNNNNNEPSVGVKPHAITLSVMRSQHTVTSPQGSGNPPGSPRHPNRPPRPQPPPPPPPSKTKQERLWESTDL